ncbi:guanine nucleotide-binding protein alpha subunit [Basidiobolus meristosporus CBS 931.73]|uniref:Guanine nucleotide-binding protein alpha-16 subunit n=1 Tax=Basidiobolus meristosporus CBS 931.73 TaxID=1314790 RepID=A0A1Y1YV58_9FUNG|nr:guanine nucleotide-binding protein alpha subunit [Basidiobolus meristosporus CBS 931.73]|eukprot:ORY01846.1 guanine nucleotide-binding protein alpha subunit [Basidiobolus meristosporus CBS 931.73]
MGCCVSHEEHDERRKNDEIENQLRKEKVAQRSEIKMLLLGAGESGKSTILKQMRLIHQNGFDEEERETFKEIIYCNTVQSMYVILEAMENIGIPLADPENAVHALVILEHPRVDGRTLPTDIAEAIKHLWKDEGVRECFKRSREFQLNDSAIYYFDSIDRIASPDYNPTDQDVLRSRIKTTGITETIFHVGEYTYRMLDVGGQRSERKKWIHCFENVTTIIFLVAISEYDQVLIEDASVNRMQEALTLFESICNSRWFTKTSMILFLNKIDLFKAKLVVSPLKQSFPEYRGGNNYESGCEYLKQKFLGLNRSNSKQIYTHFTCATDTNQVRFVMNAVNDTIIQNCLRDCGLL